MRAAVASSQCALLAAKRLDAQVDLRRAERTDSFVSRALKRFLWVVGA